MIVGMHLFDVVVVVVVVVVVAVVAEVINQLPSTLIPSLFFLP